jgi:lipopolysaccharide transport system ATP-binding protein
MTPAIRTERLGKQYQIGRRGNHTSLREAVSRVARAPFRVLSAPSQADAAAEPGVMWALEDVSFDVNHGDVIGVIGRNGSGKSTLLKILSRITEPTTGWAEVQGRVGSLLEVGTGFHPELTGRENVSVNGAILGMGRREIARKFDEIVDFAGVERFIDTPVKHYSSGMQMRLAFAVAAHLEPEILLVDEVLAVGDLAFQRKCLGKMDEVSKNGRTILFVSHQMNQLRRLCTRCVWLDAGRLVETGPTAEVVNRYEAALMSPAPDATVPGASSAPARFTGWTLLDAEDADHVLMTTGRCIVRFHLQVNTPVRNGHHGIGLYDSDGRIIWGTAADNVELEPGRHALDYVFDTLPVRPGAYRWHVTLFEDGTLLDSCACVPELSVATMPTGHRRDECAGILNVPYVLNIDQTEAQEALEDVLAHR